MRPNAYKLLGYAVWRGARWYLRRRLPAGRSLALGGVGALALAAAGVLLARRALG